MIAAIAGLLLALALATPAAAAQEQPYMLWMGAETVLYGGRPAGDTPHWYPRETFHDKAACLAARGDSGRSVREVHPATSYGGAYPMTYPEQIIHRVYACWPAGFTPVNPISVPTAKTGGR
jgi:hypothetical protein